MERADPFFHRQLRMFAGWLFSIYHDIRVEGAEHIPAEGPAIVASNHPTYLDPAFLMVGIKRPIRFMAWEKPFRIPFLGALLRSYGAIPVDMKKPGRGSFEAAVKVLRNGEAFGIFPEGGRTKGLERMNPFKSGVARLALITGAPIIPASIIGGRRVWRRGEIFPKPGPIRVVFHLPVRVPPEERAHWRRDRGREEGICARIMETINSSLLPSLRRDRRIDRVHKLAPGVPTPQVEGIPPAFLLLALLSIPAGNRHAVCIPAACWVAGYALVLGISHAAGGHGWWVIWLRHLLPWLTFAGIVHQSAGLPEPGALAAEAAVAGAIAWCAVFRFQLYRRARTVLLAAAYGGWLVHLVRAGQR